MVPSNPKKIKILLVTAVWGEWHRDVFLNVNLPTLLAPGNIPFLGTNCDIKYRIFTRSADLKKLKDSQSLKALSRFMELQFELIPEEKLSQPIAAHQWAWEQATQYSKNVGSYILFIPPDVAWSEGSFGHLGRLLSSGKKAVFMTYMRVVADTFIPALMAKKNVEENVICVDGREMVSLALTHIHPLMAAYSYKSSYFPGHSEMVLWPVRKEGVLLRVLAREMFLYDPRSIGVTNQMLMDGNFSSKDVVFVDDSDNLFGVSLTPLGKDVSWHMQYRKLNPLNIARWWLDYDSPSNDFIANVPVRWHTGICKQANWCRMEIRSARFIKNAVAAREGLRVWRELMALGCTLAASLVAIPIGFGFLRKAFPPFTAAIIFAPTDEAFKSFSDYEIQELVDCKNQKKLMTIFQHHGVFQQENRHSGLNDSLKEINFQKSFITVAGDEIKLEKSERGFFVNDFEIIGNPKKIGPFYICKIDGVLGSANRVNSLASIHST